MLAALTDIEAELKTSTVSHCKQRLRQAAADLARLLESRG